ncbi:unnamed protein product [Spirodela intermedia]|uniref:Uncharacterized protein n=1 Tax=Spirodela intermedia TaxID=51605 RepID=A0ABN7EC34_SPIIN|nr:unnamed protein product [Spirodela intermedia]
MDLHSRNLRGGRGNPYPRRLEIKNKTITDFTISVRSLVCCPSQESDKSPSDDPSRGAHLNHRPGPPRGDGVGGRTFP